MVNILKSDKISPAFVLRSEYLAVMSLELLAIRCHLSYLIIR